MKKRFLAAIVCAAALMSLTGCGKEEAPANAGNSSVSAGTNTGTSTPTTNTSTAQTESSAPQSSSAPEESKPEESKPEESSTPELPASNEDDFDWANNDDGTVTITEYYGSDENVVIPSTVDGRPVTQIYHRAFRDNIDITSVTIPASVEYIDYGVFKGCINLKEVNFLGDTPDFTLTSFEDTPWLEKKLEENKDPNFIIIDNVLVQVDKENIAGDVVIPDGVTRICSYAFGEYDAFRCQKMTSVTIPNSVTHIGIGAFVNCTNLTSITVSDNVKDIGRGAFFNCDLLESIKLPNGITEIGKETFESCRALKSIDIPNGVTTIASEAFRDCKADISLPDTVTTIDKEAFNAFTGTVTFNGKTYSASETDELIAAVEQRAIESEFGGKDFIVTDNVLEKVNPTATKIELPDTVTGIADNAFKDCDRSIIITFKGKNYNYDNLSKLKEAVNGN